MIKNLLLLSGLLIGLGCDAAYGQTIACPYNATLNAAVTTSTQVIAGQAGKKVRICKVIFNVVQTSSAINFSLTSGTGSVCATGIAQLTQIYTGTASSTQTYDQSVDSSVAWTAPAGASVCLALSGAPTSANVQIFYGLQ